MLRRLIRLYRPTTRRAGVMKALRERASPAPQVGMRDVYVLLLSFLPASFLLCPLFSFSYFFVSSFFDAKEKCFTQTTTKSACE